MGGRGGREEKEEGGMEMAQGRGGHGGRGVHDEIEGGEE